MVSRELVDEKADASAHDENSDAGLMLTCIKLSSRTCMLSSHRLRIDVRGARPTGTSFFLSR